MLDHYDYWDDELQEDGWFYEDRQDQNNLSDEPEIYEEEFYS